MYLFGTFALLTVVAVVCDENDFPCIDFGVCSVCFFNQICRGYVFYTAPRLLIQNAFVIPADTGFDPGFYGLLDLDNFAVGFSF